MRLLAMILAGIFLTAAIHAAAPPAQDTPAYDEREALAKLQAMDIFPEMEKEDSDFSNAVSTEVECLECDDPAFFKSPAWPLLVARRVAARFRMKPLTVAEIRAHVAKAFGVDADAFQQVHGIQIVSAQFSVGGEWLDVTPQMAARVNGEGFTVDCDATLTAGLGDESQFERVTDETDADYWKRQRKLLAAVAEAQPGREALRLTFEFHSETFTASAKAGERLAISEDGKVTAGKIAPAARAVRATDGVAAPVKPARPPASPPRKTATGK
jgi:hypothetical protein